jgi:calcium-dependent protein kinase
MVPWFRNEPQVALPSKGSASNEEQDLVVAIIDDVKSRASNVVRTMSRYHRDRPLLSDYTVEHNEVLGRGYAGAVVLCKSKVDGKKYALKTFSKAKATKQNFELLANEAQVYLTLDHPNIARLVDVYEDKSSVSFVIEHCAGGELYQRLQERKIYAEKDAIEATKQMLRALGYLHSHGVVHRDVKLENFLYASEANDSLLKLIDFGFAKFWDPSTKMTAACGSLAYVSPDVLSREGYTSKCDIWSLGVVVFMLLSGYPPFHGKEEADLISKIKIGKADWLERKWKNVSFAGRDFVKCLLSADPDNRPDAKQAMAHQWLQAEGHSASLMLDAGVLRSLQSYSRSSRLHRAILQIMAQELEPEETKELVEIFHRLDNTHEGVIKLTDLKKAIRGTADGSRVVTPNNGEAFKMPPTPASRLRRANSGKIDDLFHLLDTNGDQQIYYSGFLAATMEMRDRLREEALRATFHRLDANQSGTIEAADLKLILGDEFEGVEVEQVIGEAITPSAGGKIDFQDFVKVLQRRDEMMIPTPTPKGKGNMVSLADVLTPTPNGKGNMLTLKELVESYNVNDPIVGQ